MCVTKKKLHLDLTIDDVALPWHQWTATWLDATVGLYVFSGHAHDIKAGPVSTEGCYPGFNKLYSTFEALGHSEKDITTLVKYFMHLPYINDYSDTLSDPFVKSTLERACLLNMNVNDMIGVLEDHIHSGDMPVNIVVPHDVGMEL